ncbi:hypothetical protein GCM10027613_45790 [Microlunatus endophyticus]
MLDPLRNGSLQAVAVGEMPIGRIRRDTDLASRVPQGERGRAPDPGQLQTGCDQCFPQVAVVIALPLRH